MGFWRFPLRLLTVVGLAIATSLSPAAAAQTRARLPEAMRPGQVTERVVSAADSLRTYALYLPSSFTAARSWPLVIVMDPRGRALLPLERIRAPAERFGWVVLSSWDTRSDDPAAPNIEAANAMLDDAQRFLHPDTKRFYFAGFSGTARVAWDYASRLDGAVAGIIASGAGLPQRPQWLLTPGLPHPAFFGTAGLVDFNYDEVVALEPWLDRAGFAWRTRYFEGGHEWMPDTLFAEALAWMELQAMRSGLAVGRAAFIDSLYSTAMRRATLADSPLEALEAYRGVIRDFGGLHDTGEASAGADSLAPTARVRRAQSEKAEVAKDAARFDGLLASFLDELRQAGHPPTLARALSRLGVERLLREAARTGERARALAAQRKLESTFVNVSFYEPARALGEDRPAHALLLLDIADRIHPDRPGVLVMRARVLVRLRRTDEALGALERAVRKGADRTSIAADSAFGAMRDDPRFTAITRG